MHLGCARALFTATRCRAESEPKAERLFHYNGDKWGVHTCVRAYARLRATSLCSGLEGGRAARARGERYREITACARDLEDVFRFISHERVVSTCMCRHQHRWFAYNGWRVRSSFLSFVLLSFLHIFSLSLSLPLADAPLVSREHDNNTIWDYEPQNIT